MQPARDESRIKPEEVSRLLERHRVLESLAARQQTERRDLLEQMQRRENLAELQRYLRGGHPADLASMLATVPPEDPAQDASVVLTFVTDGMGFLLFLGLAYVFL